MTGTRPSNSSLQQLLGRTLVGQDQVALKAYAESGLILALIETARANDVLPALAVRCHEQGLGSEDLGVEVAALLKSSLLENTRRNMSIIAQALKLASQLNQVGITPLFLKGAARLLTGSGDNVGFRKQVDIDLIVQPDELIAAGNAHLADGYRYCEFSRDGKILPLALADTAEAQRLSAAHHHLPPLVNDYYAATVELHRHFLPGRFQRGNPLEPLFETARTVTSHDATFAVPSTEYQLIHLVLGTLVNDGLLARRSFPLREACDLISILDEAEGSVDLNLVSRHCGNHFLRFYSLVSTLLGYRSASAGAGSVSTAGYIRMMKKRYDSPLVQRLLDTYARLEYLAYEMAYSPSKLPAYLGRVVFPAK